MITRLKTLPAPVRSRTSGRVANLVVIIGGSKTRLAKSFAHRPHTKVIVIDNDVEIERNKRHFRKLGVQYFTAARGETLASMMSHAPPAVQAAARQVAGMSTEYGLGARPHVGYQAALLTIDSPDFRAFLAHLNDDVLTMTRGRPRSVHVTFLGSSAGATMTGAGIAIAEVIERQINRMGIPVHITFDLLGPTTYAGLSSRCRQNAASMLCSVLAYVLRAPGANDCHVVRHLRLHEAEPFGENRDVRDLFLRLECEALLSRELNEKVELERPNDALDGPLGNIQLRDVESFRPLDPRTEVVPAVATILAQELADALTAAEEDRSLIAELLLPDQVESSQRESIESLVSRAGTLDTATFVTAVRRPSATTTFRTLIRTREGNQYDCERIESYFSSPPTTLDEAIDRLRLLRSVRRRVEDELRLVEDDLLELTRAMEHQESRVRSLHERVGNRSWWRKPRALENGAEQLRQLSDEVTLLRGQEVALRDALEPLVKELAYHEQLVQSVDAMLSEYLPCGTNQSFTPLVAVKNLNEILPDLLAALTQSPEEQLAVLSTFVGSVTKDGVARIVASPTNRSVDIAVAVVQGEPLLEGPPHGAHARQDKPSTFYVLPPCSPVLEADLREAIKNCAHEGEVAFADSCDAGASVLRAHFRKVRDINELFLGLVRHDLLDAINDPLHELNFINGFRDFEAIGGRIIDDEIHFVYPPPTQP